jgi:ankyrin repeat protein
MHLLTSCLQMLEMLLDRGAPIDGHNKQGWTALHRAAYNGRVDACRLLLRRGASIHAVTNTGATALHLAASNNHLGVMELLLQLGASTQMT